MMSTGYECGFDWVGRHDKGLMSDVQNTNNDYRCQGQSNEVLWLSPFQT